MPEESPERRIDRLQRILQQAILRDYPNPERKGCPGDEALRKLAAREYAEDHPAWEHVTHCSPCYGEFLRFVDDLRGVEEARRAAGQRKLFVAIACVAVLAVVGGGVYWRASSRNTGAPPVGAPYEQAALDLKSEPIRRGDRGATGEATQRRLPRKRLELSIYLPVGSERGRYEIRLVQKAGEPVLETQGIASVENGTTALRTRLDLHRLAAGQYFLGVRQPPWDWTYVPLILE